MAKILIIADVEDKCSATPRGLELAAKLGQDVEVVAFTYAPLKALKVSTHKQGIIKKRLLEEREKAVSARIEKFRWPDQKIKLSVVWVKDAESWVTKACASGDYSCVIKTGTGEGSLIQASSDWQLLRSCKVPVLLVAAKKWHRTKPVMVALDLTTSVASKRTLNRKVLRIATAMAQALEVELEIITAIEIPALLSDLDLIDPIAYEKDARESMQPQIAKLAAEFDLPASAFHCKRGPVEKVLTSHAAKVRAQIVVMGTVARKGVKARLLGNTAEKVLRHMKTDVLAIKP